jgi:hypothetical protein
MENKKDVWAEATIIGDLEFPKSLCKWYHFTVSIVLNVAHVGADPSEP